MKTLKQMADELGVSKQRLYRFVKQEGISEVHQENKTMYYDETAEKAIRNAFENSDTRYDTADVNHDAPIDTGEVHQKNSDVYHDVLLETQKHNEKIIEMLQLTHQKELESRDEQIRQLQSENQRLQSELAIERQHNREVTDNLTQLSDKFAQLADQAQQLQLIQMQPPALPVDEETPKQKPSFWKRIFGRKE